MLRRSRLIRSRCMVFSTESESSAVHIVFDDTEEARRGEGAPRWCVQITSLLQYHGRGDAWFEPPGDDVCGDVPTRAVFMIIFIHL